MERGGNERKPPAMIADQSWPDSAGTQKARHPHLKCSLRRGIARNSVAVADDPAVIQSPGGRFLMQLYTLSEAMTWSVIILTRASLSTPAGAAPPS
jgi:hypothetical protein